MNDLAAQDWGRPISGDWCENHSLPAGEVQQSSDRAESGLGRKPDIEYLDQEPLQARSRRSDIAPTAELRRGRRCLGRLPKACPHVRLGYGLECEPRRRRQGRTDWGAESQPAFQFGFECSSGPDPDCDSDASSQRGSWAGIQPQGEQCYHLVHSANLYVSKPTSNEEE